MAATAPTAQQILADTVSQARLDPVWFAEHVLQIRRLPDDPEPARWYLDAWQVELLEAAADVWRHQQGLPTRFNHRGKNKISVRAMHGPGKTFGLAILMHWFRFCFPAKVPCTAPKLGQLQTRLWPEFEKIRQRAIPSYRRLMMQTSTQILWLDSAGRYSKQHSAFMETATAPENLAGLHEDFLLFCVDEASGVPEALWPVIEGALSTGVFVLLVIISNPTKNTGTFADSHLREKVRQGFYTLHISLDKTTRVSRQWVRDMELKYGVGSPVVAVRCHGEFAAEDANQLIPLEWISRARDQELVEEGDGSLPKLRVTIDVADGGLDFTVVTVARHFQTVVQGVRQEQFNFPSSVSPIRAAEAGIELFERFGGIKERDDFVVDAIGVGAGTAGYLAERGFSVVGYKGGGASDDPVKWRNRRVQSYLVARDAFRDQRVVLADNFVDDDDWEDLEAQLCSVRRKPGMERVEDLETKEDMRRRGLKSPDRADSWAMQYATQAPIVKGGLEQPLILATMETNSYDAGIT